jgi:hypothetical protein
LRGATYENAAEEEGRSNDEVEPGGLDEGRHKEEHERGHIHQQRKQPAWQLTCQIIPPLLACPSRIVCVVSCVVCVVCVSWCVVCHRRRST